jgi:hypothetical protein
LSFSCSANELNADTGQSTPSGTKSIVIDVDQGLVSMDIGTFTITQVTENDLSFQDRAWKGHMDRLSWSGFVTPRVHVPGNVKVELACKPAKP